MNIENVKVFIAISVCLAGIGVFSGCHKIRSDQVTGQGGLVLHESDKGSSKTIEIGSTFHLVLPTNPSTGYNWEIDSYNASVLNQLGEARFETEGPFASKVPIVGQGGVLIFMFEGLAKGETLLKLKYHRTWENRTPLKVFEITIIVQPKNMPMKERNLMR